MEKRRPSHDLNAFRTRCGDPRYLTITTTALRSAAGLGFGRLEIVAVIRAMKPVHFYKSMTGYRDSRRWQDVYHVPWGNMVLYVKFTDDAVTEFVVLSFKEQ